MTKCWLTQSLILLPCLEDVNYVGSYANPSSRVYLPLSPHSSVGKAKSNNLSSGPPEHRRWERTDIGKLSLDLHIYTVEHETPTSHQLNNQA